MYLGLAATMVMAVTSNQMNDYVDRLEIAACILLCIRYSTPVA